MKSISLTILLSLFLFACNGESTQAPLPAKNFKDQYTLADFKLNDIYQYWEIRKGNHSYQSQGHEVLYQFDETKYTQLSTQQIERLQTIHTDYGYDSQCQPEYCPIYAVAVQPDNYFVIQSETDLIVFFEEIDTEAEVFYYLSKSGTSPKSFEKNTLGYKVLVAWDNHCGTRGEKLVQVHTDGTVETIKELNESHYDGCY